MSDREKHTAVEIHVALARLRSRRRKRKHQHRTHLRMISLLQVWVNDFVMLRNYRMLLCVSVFYWGNNMLWHISERSCRRNAELLSVLELFRFQSVILHQHGFRNGILGSDIIQILEPLYYMYRIVVIFGLFSSLFVGNLFLLRLFSLDLLGFDRFLLDLLLNLVERFYRNKNDVIFLEPYSLEIHGLVSIANLIDTYPIGLGYGEQCLPFLNCMRVIILSVTVSYFLFRNSNRCLCVVLCKNRLVCAQCHGRQYCGQENFSHLSEFLIMFPQML